MTLASWLSVCPATRPFPDTRAAVRMYLSWQPCDTRSTRKFVRLVHLSTYFEETRRNTCIFSEYLYYGTDGMFPKGIVAIVSQTQVLGHVPTMSEQNKNKHRNR